MNCFHFSVSLGYKTTSLVFIFSHYLLWIAFIFQYLWDTKQQESWLLQREGSCELLSFFSIFGIQNNLQLHKHGCFPVVNCFHFSVSLGYKTTFEDYGRQQRWLWIAFIFQYLWDTKQQESTKAMLIYCCELLSFFSIFGIQNNIPQVKQVLSLVVNCFHFSVSLGYKTTFFFKRSYSVMLWIALATPNRLAFPLLDFIFQYLWDTKQPLTVPK